MVSVTRELMMTPTGDSVCEVESRVSVVRCQQ